MIITMKNDDLGNAIIRTAGEMKANAQEAMVGDVITTIERVEGHTVVLKEGYTETNFWLELLPFVLLSGDAFDNFLEGKPIA